MDHRVKPGGDEVIASLFDIVDRKIVRRAPSSVIAGLDPAIHAAERLV
jgi:hypothetical protein